MMSVKLVVLAAVVATCCAKPFYFSAPAFPELGILRAGRSPSIAYGFGSGFASDIGGVKHSNSIGASFQTGDGEAYGAGIGSTDGGINANGVGYAHTNPAPLAYRNYPYAATPYAATPYAATPYAATPYYTYPYNVGYNNGYNNIGSPVRDSYGNTIATAQNVGSSGQSNALSQNGPWGSTAIATNFNPYQSRNSLGTFGSSTASFAVSTGAGSNAKSFTQTYDGQGGINASGAVSEHDGDAKGSTAYSIQQRGSEVQHSGATTIDGPGIHASHSHAVNTGATGTFY